MTLKSQTIYEQLGGGRFRAMTGARDFVHGPASLTFSIARAKGDINRVKISLRGSDLYDIEFYHIRGLNFDQISSASGVYAEDLQRVFKHHTGLETHL